MLQKIIICTCISIYLLVVNATSSMHVEVMFSHPEEITMDVHLLSYLLNRS